MFNLHADPPTQTCVIWYTIIDFIRNTSSNFKNSRTTTKTTFRFQKSKWSTNSAEREYVRHGNDVRPKHGFTSSERTKEKHGFISYSKFIKIKFEINIKILSNSLDNYLNAFWFDLVDRCREFRRWPWCQWFAGMSHAALSRFPSWRKRRKYIPAAANRIRNYCIWTFNFMIIINFDIVLISKMKNWISWNNLKI